MSDDNRGQYRPSELDKKSLPDLVGELYDTAQVMLAVRGSHLFALKTGYFAPSIDGAITALVTELDETALRTLCDAAKTESERRGLVASADKRPETYSIATASGDRTFLRFIADRLVNVHGENPIVDYIQTLRRFADAFEPLPSRERVTPAVDLLAVMVAERERLIADLRAVVSHHEAATAIASEALEQAAETRQQLEQRVEVLEGRGPEFAEVPGLTALESRSARAHDVFCATLTGLLMGAAGLPGPQLDRAIKVSMACATAISDELVRG